MNVFWTPEKIADLKARVEGGATYDSLTAIFDKSADAIKAAYHRHVVGRCDEAAEKIRNAAMIYIPPEALGKPDKEVLITIGEALYGKLWQAAMARTLGVNKDTITNGVNGSWRPKRGVYINLVDEMKARRDKLDGLIEGLSRALEE